MSTHAQMTDTRQPLVPNAQCVRDVRGGQTMPWCKCIVDGTGDCGKG